MRPLAMICFAVNDCFAIYKYKSETTEMIEDGDFKMPKLIMLRGNSGSGKSTVAKMLQQKLGRNTMLISQDMVRREILCVKDNIDTPAAALLKTLLQYGRRNCEIVILEGILYTAWYESLFICAQQEYGDEIFAYYYDLPFAETVVRHKTKANSNEFGEEKMCRWWHEKDFISFIPEKILGKEMTAAETADYIYREVIG